MHGEKMVTNKKALTIASFNFHVNANEDLSKIKCHTSFVNYKTIYLFLFESTKLFGAGETGSSQENITGKRMRAALTPVPLDAQRLLPNTDPNALVPVSLIALRHAAKY